MTSRLTYFKRYRMEVDLSRPWPADAPPAGFDLLPWDDRLLDAHAEAKFASFHQELDARLFPSFHTLDGCRGLMRAIRARPGFCPQASWLAFGPDGVAGTIQGLHDAAERGVGAVQNVGVVPGCRGSGVGAALLAKALAGFRATGCRRVYLDVTAQNGPAVRLYRRFGFRCYRTIYKPVEPATEAPLALGL